MKRIEICAIPPLSPGEESLLDFHSLINIFHVLRCEMMNVGEVIAKESNLLAGSLAAADSILTAIRQQGAMAGPEELNQFERLLWQELQAYGARLLPEVESSLENITVILEILKVRTLELQARSLDPGAWVDFDIVTLEEDLRTFLAALEKNSRGRFGIVQNAAVQTDKDYYVDLRMESHTAWVRLPHVFTDVLRDLVANARKFTAPGGHIVVAVHQDAGGTSVVVRDTGCGIPADELELVVHFGKRASNALGFRTNGGGFGLTKAFFIAKRFGGRFWIASELSRGTEVKLWLPASPNGSSPHQPS